MATRPRTKKPTPTGAPARIEYLRVENYRALRSIELDLTPMTVLLGPNGSGKSTVFDVFNFLSECFTVGLRDAWDKRQRFQELRSRGASGPIVFELRYRETPVDEPATYHLEIDEEAGRPIVVEEWLQWRRVSKSTPGAPFKILSFKRGTGWVISGKRPEKDDTKVRETLDEPDLLAVSTLGRLTSNPHVATLRRFITDWYVSYLAIDDTRGQPQAGAHERLSKTGDNLANVVQFLRERHPARLEEIFEILRQRIPRVEKVLTQPSGDGRLLLQIKDGPFDEPVLARFASDGTLKLLAYLLVLHSPNLPQFIGIEEPENFLHPRILPELAEECRAATEHSQLLITTHSPFILNALKADEVRVLYRAADGFTKVTRASDIQGIEQFMTAGASLGQLWLEGRFGVGDPLVRSGGPAKASSKR